MKLLLVLIVLVLAGCAAQRIEGDCEVTLDIKRKTVCKDGTVSTGAGYP